MKSLSNIVTLILAALVLLLAPGLPAVAAGGTAPEGRKVKISFQGREAVAVLFENGLAEEFLRLLPMETEFSDFSGTEKIFYLPEKLPVQGSPNADERKGDFCYFAPWGNIAVFYQGYGHGKNLYVVGMLESGKEALAAMKENFKARIEVLGPVNGQ